MGDIKAYSNNKTLCLYVNDKGVKGKGIALSNKQYCRHHIKHDTTLDQTIETMVNQQARYIPSAQSVRERMNINLASPSLLDLRHEVALLQAWLQELMDAPVTNFNKQMQIIDRIERLVTNFQRVKLSAQALAQAENKVRLVINNVVLIIKAVVSDKSQRQEIARRLAELGQAYEKEQESATLSSVLIQETPIQQEAPINNINNQALEPGAERAQAKGAETEPETQG